MQDMEELWQDQTTDNLVSEGLGITHRCEHTHIDVLELVAV